MGPTDERRALYDALVAAECALENAEADEAEAAKKAAPYEKKLAAARQATFQARIRKSEAAKRLRDAIPDPFEGLDA